MTLADLDSSGFLDFQARFASALGLRPLGGPWNSSDIPKNADTS